MHLSFERSDLAALVQGALDTVRPAADAKGITLLTTLAPDAGPILCAPDRIRQVVWNLAMNAIKFTPAGGRVEVRVDRAEDGCRVVVADNGVPPDSGLGES
jgi:signal transduction histidine kinase